MSALTPGQEAFARAVAKGTGLDLNVVRGWALAEESYTAARNRDSSHNFNYLNIGVGPAGDRFNPGWTTPQQAAANTVAFLKGEKFGPDPSITAILDTAGLHPVDQIHAIAVSKWDAGHYGGDGSSLLNTYHLVSGQPVSIPSSAPVTHTPSAVPASKPSTPQTPADTASTPLHMRGSSIALPGPDGNPFSGAHLKGAKIPLPMLVPPVLDPPKAITSAVVSLKDPTSTVGSTILATAKSQLGVKYVWGGETPGVAFDCSGLVQWAAKQHGVNLPRTSEQQVHSGTAVSIVNLKPGDLLFFGNANAPHHVAIYAGGGKMLQAPHTGGHVEIVPMRTPSAIRRLPPGT